MLRVQAIRCYKKNFGFRALRPGSLRLIFGAEGAGWFCGLGSFDENFNGT